MNKRILFIVSNLNIGGMQKSLLALANHLSENNNVTIYSIEGVGDLQRGLKNSIKVIEGNHKVANYVRLLSIHKNKLCKDYKSYIKKGVYRYLQKGNLGPLLEEYILRDVHITDSYDISISYTGFPGIWDKIVLSKVKARKKIVWIHSDPYKLGINKINANNYYNRFDVVVNVSLDCKNKFDEIACNLRNKSYLIYNLIDESEVKKMALMDNPYKNNENDKFIISTVARLQNDVKRFDRIIDCCKLLSKAGYKNFEWHIVGGGPDLEWLKEKISEENLKGYILVEGSKENPYPYIMHSNLFVLTSDYEGFGITVKEALILKVPVIITEFNTAHELIENGYNGLIVEKNETSLFNAIKSLMTNKKEYSRIKSNIDDTNNLDAELLNEVFEK